MELTKRLSDEADLCRNDGATDTADLLDEAVRALNIETMVDRFLMWPLPDSVCSDLCVTKRGAQHRIGTNLLAADEARQMLEYVFAAHAKGGEVTHSKQYLVETVSIADSIKAEDIEAMVKELVALRGRRGRLFLIGLGGSAANCSHAVNDFRKLCGIEAYSPVDNVAELTARANDEGWESIFSEWLQFATNDDAIFILSVGGGSMGVSLPIYDAINSAKEKQMCIYGVVGRDGGYTKQAGDCVIVVPTVSPERITPHTEGWQSVILHCIVSHPDLQIRGTKW